MNARREWVHNGVREVKAIIIVYSRRVGVERGVFKISQPYEVTAGGNTHLKVVAQLQYTMASSKFGRKLNPYRSLLDHLGVKGVRQSVAITNNPSRIDQNQQLLVRFPNLGKDDVILPGTARLAFTITLNREDANRTVVQSLGRAIVKKLTIKISGNEVMSIDDSDVFHCYNDYWKKPQRGQMVIIRGSTPLITETRRGFESLPETESQALPLTRPSLMSSVIASSLHSTSSCSRATFHFTRAHWAAGSSMSSLLTTTAV